MINKRLLCIYRIALTFHAEVMKWSSFTGCNFPRLRLEGDLSIVIDTLLF